MDKKQIRKEKNMSKVIDNFLRYVKIDTQSAENDLHPSTAKQHDLAKLLYKELQEMGASDVIYDREHCYVYATVPGNTGSQKVLGFIAHMDTSPAVTDTNVNPRIVKQYDGSDIVLSEEDGIVLSPKDFPSLLLYKGEDLIVTDGKTLLGADDKAGVAEIMAMAEYLLTHPEVPHGTVKIGFTPDEEWVQAPIFLTFRCSAPILPIRWTADASANWNMKTSMRQAPR